MDRTSQLFRWHWGLEPGQIEQVDYEALQSSARLGATGACDRHCGQSKMQLHALILFNEL
jgi:hypothetical protein